MGGQCSTEQEGVNDLEGFDGDFPAGFDRDFVEVASTPVPASAATPSAGSKRNRQGKRRSFRHSLFRVGSRSNIRPATATATATATLGPMLTAPAADKHSFRHSLFRVGSGRRPATATAADNDIPGSPRARASTYSHVHDAVMYNLSNAERSKHDQSVPMGVIGLRNLGNTCFINSSLQCLSATIPLTDYFLGYDYRSEINKANFLGTEGKLVTAYAVLIKQMWLGQKSAVEPIDFKEQLATFAPQFSGYHQHDSQELLSFLLDGIHEDLNRVKERPYVEDKDCDGTRDENDAIENWKNYLRRNKSLVVDLFQGQLRNTCKCLTCGHINIRFEAFMYLSLPMSEKSRSVDDCINLYLEEEVLQGADQWYCEKCEKHVDATRKTDLWILPPILIVHLKRFRYNDCGKVGSKNDATIDYPVNQWDLKSRVRSLGGVYPMYDLYAVSNHMGGLGGGHYTALSLNRFDDVWYEFNDSSYRPVDESIHKHHTKSAYVLFYNRSEGDVSAPLNERSPLIRRQSVSRPDLWPHTQVDDRAAIRDFTRFSRRSMDLPTLDAVREWKSTGTGDAASNKNGVALSLRTESEGTKNLTSGSDRKQLSNSRHPSSREDDEGSKISPSDSTFRQRKTSRSRSPKSGPRSNQGNSGTRSNQGNTIRNGDSRSTVNSIRSA